MTASSHGGFMMAMDLFSPGLGHSHPKLLVLSFSLELISRRGEDGGTRSLSTYSRLVHHSITKRQRIAAILHASLCICSSLETMLSGENDFSERLVRLLAHAELADIAPVRRFAGSPRQFAKLPRWPQSGLTGRGGVIQLAALE
jgi:hypothetical protein